MQQTDEGLHVALSVLHRTGNDYIPTIDGNGVAHYNVLTGTQVVDPANGVLSANPNRAEWSFNFDVSSGPQTLQQYLQGHDIFLTFQQEGTNATPVVLHAVYDPAHATGGSPIVWDDAQGHVVSNDNEGNAHILANTGNIDFEFLKPTGYELGNATFDIHLTVVDQHAHVNPYDHAMIGSEIIADVHAVVVVGQGAPVEHHNV